MTIIIDGRQLEKLRSRRRKPKRILSRANNAKAERELKAQMNKLWQRVLHPASETIKQMVKRGASPVELADFISRTLDHAEYQYGIAAEDITWRWKKSLDENTQRHMQHGLNAALGVDISAVLNTPEISDALAMGSLDAAGLIKTIPGEYLGKVARAVSDNMRGQPLPEGRSLLDQIQHIGNVSKKRAQVIARDQTAKLGATLDKERQQSAGVSVYIWRTMGDERVVGKPGGIYPAPKPSQLKSPVLHHSHWIMEGKYCKWNDPGVYSTDGKTWKSRTDAMPHTHPGMEIQCRCYAEPVIDIDGLLKNARTG